MQITEIIQRQIAEKPHLTPSSQLVLDTSEVNMKQAISLCSEDTLAELQAEEKRLLSKLYLANPEEIKIILGRLLVHYSLGNSLNESQQRILFADYIEDLAEYPADVIMQATKDYRRDLESKFFPKIGELRALCDARVRPTRKLLAKIQSMIRAIKNENIVGIHNPRPKPEDFRILIKKLSENF